MWCKYMATPGMFEVARIYPVFVPKSPIESSQELIQLMLLATNNDKPVFAPVMAQFTYAYMYH